MKTMKNKPQLTHNKHKIITFKSLLLPNSKRNKATLFAEKTTCKRKKGNLLVEEKIILTHTFVKCGFELK